MKYQRTIELLAPAANYDVAVAAIKAGADAIYIGAERFSARSRVGNSLEDIERLCNYAHPYGVRIYLALNTLLYTDSELRDAEDLARRAIKCGIDAIIFQDVRLLDMNLPIEMHASTQTAQYTTERAAEFQDSGISRIVLERGLSLEEIRAIRGTTTKELEVFVHGAICVGYSGICNLSEHLTGRSGNRGECAQPCRSSYDLVDRDGAVIFRNEALLSPRDLNLSRRLGDLIDAGVSSLKIEGRLKDKDYVSNVVAYYHNLLQNMGVERSSWGRVQLGFTPDLNLSFNRGFTEWFFDGVESASKPQKIYRLAQSVEGIGEYIGKVKAVGRDFIDVTLCSGITINNGDGLFFRGDRLQSSGVRVNRANDSRLYLLSTEGLKEGIKLYRNSRAGWSTESERFIGITIDATEKSTKDSAENPEIIFTAKSNVNTEYSISLNPEEYEVSKDSARGISMLESGLKRSGGTIFEVSEVNISLNTIPFLPSSRINSIRRELLAGLENTLREYSIARFATTEHKYSSAGIENTKVDYLMKSRYCILREKGLCLSKGSAMKLPLYLVNNGVKLRLRFDCKDCCMYIERQ